MHGGSLFMNWGWGHMGKMYAHMLREYMDVASGRWKMWAARQGPGVIRFADFNLSPGCFYNQYTFLHGV